jgi:uncharacterized protein YbjT (DUF2867 family)
MRVIVFGATGGTGRATLLALVAAGHQVTRNVSTTLRQPVWEIRLGVEASGLAG